MEMLHQDITDKIISAFYKVYNELGFGFLERVYENALFEELTAAGLQCQKQKPIKVYYNKKVVGEYFADLIVNDCIIFKDCAPARTINIVKERSSK